MQNQLGLTKALLFWSALAVGLSAEVQTASAYQCVHTIMGVCTSEGEGCDPPDYGHCYTVKQRDYPYKKCACLKERPERPHGASMNLGIGGIHIGIGGGHSIGFDVNTGGYCDRWGCPGDYWGYPVFYGPVYFDGEWYDGPVYYREVDGGYEYWVHGDWHRDEWRGPRPDWARDTHYGPTLGRDYYQSDEFRHGHEADDHDRGDHATSTRPSGSSHDTDRKDRRDRERDGAHHPH